MVSEIINEPDVVLNEQRLEITGAGPHSSECIDSKGLLVFRVV